MLRKPLILNAGQIQQLQAGDTLDAPVSAIDVIEMTNGNASSIVIGSPVYVDADDSVDLAQADASGTIQLIGLVRAVSITAAVSGEIQTDGFLVATTGQWDAVTGETGGLVAGTVYYLSKDTAGKLVIAAPSAVGEFVVRVGLAMSTTEMEITIEPPIKL